ncbi:MAG: methylenetetrahydrofolate reductase C-terminal domain-containing protein [Thermodesulfobacteriota bacterium]
MVKGKRKPLEEIRALLAPYNKVLLTGCGGCVSVCLAGGQKEVNLLISDLKMLFKQENTPKELKGYTVERQCNQQFLAELDDMVGDHDCLVSMACGAGVQYLAERFPGKPVFPAINTLAIGVDREIGVYEEKCRACGECVLAYTGGICPVTRCAKGLFNGPCGGTNKGMCEISNQIPCAWYDIYNRLKEQNRLADILKIQMPMEWRNQTQRTIVQEAYERRYAGK